MITHGLQEWTGAALGGKAVTESAQRGEQALTACGLTVRASDDSGLAESNTCSVSPGRQSGPARRFAGF